MGIQPIVVPYNFIPLSSWTFHPNWANDTYHDVPFSDGLSGRIDYELKNFSPICVGHAVKSVKNQDGKTETKHLVWERDAKDHLVIPGSSIKGLLRTALEIVSFGRMQFFHDRKHAFRLKIGDVKGVDSSYDLMPVFLRPRSDGLWEYFKVDVVAGDKPECASVTTEILANILGVSQNKIATASASEKFGYLYKKFNLLPNAPMPLLYAKTKHREEYSANQLLKPENKRHKTKWQEVVSVSVNPGEHDCVGMFQFMNENIANKGSPKANKFSDYFFYVRDASSLDESGRWIVIDNKDLVKDLNQSLPPMKADSEGIKSDNLYNFNYSHMHKEYGFPVWYLKSKKGGLKDALGFCQVMRKDKSLSVGDMIRAQVKYTDDKLPDLPELMFGCLGSDDKNGLGSRIGFSDLRTEGVPEITSREYVLGEPKPTFYPQYLGKFGFQRQYEDGSFVAGRKMYKIRDQFKLADSKFPNENVNVRTAIDFASKGSVFRGSVVFHNLKPEELGALLWVMTFGQGTESGSCKYYHALGHAKPMGAGAVKFILDQNSVNVPQYMIRDGRISVGGFSCEKNEIIARCIEKFQELMNLNYPFSKSVQTSISLNKWGKSAIISSYLDNATEDHDALPDKVYNDFPKEFSNIKRDYENSPGANDYKGSYPNGKQPAEGSSFLMEENYEVNAILKEREKYLKEIEEDKRKKAEKELADAREKAEKEMAAARQKEAALGGYSDVLKSGNLVKIFAYAIAHSEAKTQFEQDVAAGKFTKTWKYGTFNQLLKSIAADPDYKDESSLDQVADDIIEVVDDNSDAKAELRKIAKDGRNKPLLKSLMTPLYEKLQ